MNTPVSFTTCTCIHKGVVNTSIQTRLVGHNEKKNKKVIQTFKNSFIEVQQETGDFYSNAYMNGAGECAHRTHRSQPKLGV